MGSCRRAARLASESYARDLSLAERASLRAHLFFCGMCRAYSRQLELMRKLTHDLQNERADSGVPGLSEAARERIKQRLTDQTKRGDFG